MDDMSREDDQVSDGLERETAVCVCVVRGWWCRSAYVGDDRIGRARFGRQPLIGGSAFIAIQYK